jgi:hypothetical protein|nr:MAG TPA: hypothetical protein [Caudoviricetes sp.]
MMPDLYAVKKDDVVICYCASEGTAKKKAAEISGVYYGYVFVCEAHKPA